MDDPLSSLGLTAVTLCMAQSNSVDVLIKRPYKYTLTYQHISLASYKRLERLSRSDSAELVQVPNTGHEAYYLFYWQKRLHIQLGCQSLPDLDSQQPPVMYSC